MRTIDAVRRSGVAIGPDRTITEAAEIMDRAGVGALGIVDGDVLVGIVTDRDLVRRGMARRLPPDARVDAVMTSPVVTIDAEADVREAYGVFRSNAVRRLPVVRERSLVGMLTVDDLLVHLAGELADLVRPVTAELLFPHRDSAVPARA